MINVLGLCLLATSLVTASIFSPNPTQQQQQQQQKQAANTIVKEGHRVVVVEYDQDGYQNTKISFSPEQPHHEEDFTKTDSDNIIDNAKDRIKEASSVLPNIGQGISQDSSHFLHSTPNPKELICDAYGKCKHRISNAMGKTKEMTQDAIHKKSEEAREVKETVSDAVNKAKETVFDKVHDVNEYTKESMEKGRDMGQTVKEHVVRNVSDVKEGKRGVVSKIRWCLESVESLMNVANLLGFASAYGMCVWITFVSSYVLSRAMPRQQFAVVQSKIYPVYFRAMAYCLGVALLGHVLGHGRKGHGAEVLQTWNLLASLLAVFVNSVYLEPRATKLMFERMKIEKEEGRGKDYDLTPERNNNRTEEHHQRSTDPKNTTTTFTTTVPVAGTTTTGAVESPTKGKEHDAVRSRIMKLNNKLKRLNSHSSILNILNLMSLTWHLVYLAQRVHSC